MTFSSRTTLDFFSPLFFPLLCLLISIILCVYSVSAQVPYGAPFLFFFMLITALIYSNHSRFFHIISLSLCIAIGGWARTISIFERYHHIPFGIPLTSITAEVIATSLVPHARIKQHTTLSLIMINDHPVPVPLHIQIYTAPTTDLEIGDTIEINNVTIKKPTNADFNNYLLKEGIVATLFIEHLEYKRIQRPTHSLARWLSYKRDGILQAFQHSLSRPTFALFASLFLGEKQTSKKTIESLQKYFKQWGILHYLARSGLHLVIVLSVYEFLLRLFPISFGTKHLLLLVFNSIYFLLSWPSVSFVRAFLIFLLYKLFSLVYIPTHFLHILYLSCIIILLYNPLQLFFLDFQLSFGFTFALGWLNQYKVETKR